VQRVENGKGVGIETLAALAGALDASVEELRFDPFGLVADMCGVAREDLTPGMLQAKLVELNAKKAQAQADFDKKYLRVPIVRVVAPMAFGAANGVHAMQTYLAGVSEDAQDLFAGLRQAAVIVRITIAKRASRVCAASRSSWAWRAAHRTSNT
jgi:hypothetical protein